MGSMMKSEHETRFKLVATAANGEEALTLFMEHRPEVVTMDITMPNIDGIECIEKLVAMAPGVKILVVSALNDKATGMEALERGAMGVINKPFTEDDINQALNILIDD
ncbi:MAG: response regulator [Pseudomonadota bacterium]